MNIQIADRLVSLRKQHRLSQEALAEQLGISRQAISKWERAEASPDTENLLALAALYGVSMDSIVHPESAVQNAAQTENEKHDKKPKKVKEPKLHLPKTPLQQAGLHMLKFPFPLLVIALFFCLGFGLKQWHPTWLVLLLLPIYYHLSGAFCVRRKKALLLALPVPDVLLSIYLSIGFLGGIWSPTWIMLLLIPLYYWLVACFYHDGQGKKPAKNM